MEPIQTQKVLRKLNTVPTDTREPYFAPYSDSILEQTVFVGKAWSLQLPDGLVQNSNVKFEYEVDTGAASFVTFDSSQKSLKIAAGATTAANAGDYTVSVYLQATNLGQLKSETLSIKINVKEIPADVAPPVF